MKYFSARKEHSPRVTHSLLTSLPTRERHLLESAAYQQFTQERSEDELGVYLLLIGFVREVLPIYVLSGQMAVTCNKGLLFLPDHKGKLDAFKKEYYFFNVQTYKEEKMACDSTTQLNFVYIKKK